MARSCEGIPKRVSAARRELVSHGGRTYATTKKFELYDYLALGDHTLAPPGAPAAIELARLTQMHFLYSRGTFAI